MASEIEIIEEIGQFLEYVAKQDNNAEARREERLKEKFGAEKFDRLLSICFFGESKYVKREVERFRKEYRFKLRITPKGLKFLGENAINKKMEGNARTTLFLTSVLVLTAIAVLFNETGVPKPLLIIFYGIFVFLLIRYFKKSKHIRI